MNDDGVVEDVPDDETAGDASAPSRRTRQALPSVADDVPAASASTTPPSGPDATPVEQAAQDRPDGSSR